jgi:beta-glucosidase
MSQKQHAIPICAVTILFGCAGPSATTSASATEPLRADGADPAAWADDRALLLVGQMTTAQKIAELQHDAPAIPPLGLAAYNYWNEGLHGVLASGATSFPQAIALGSSWDPDLVHRVATAISDEARGIHVRSGKGLTYWSPVINMLRDPRWGRFEESYSEDPYLMGRMGVAFVTGMQGDDSKYLKTVSTPTHSAANTCEASRHTGSSDMDEATLHEYYLPAFRAAVVEGQAFSVMAAYNSVNGVPSAANTLLLSDILRTAWGFSGYVVSDCDAVSDIVTGHHFVATAAEAAAKALLAGTDLNCGTTYPSALPEALAQGLVTEHDVDVALTRVLRARFLLGEFDPADQVSYQTITPAVVESPANAQLALEAAREAIVLLKNDGALLPLDRSSLRSIAVIGPHADDVTLGGYSGVPTRTVSPLSGITAKLPPGVSITTAPGCSIVGAKDQAAIDTAVAIARASDVAIVVAGTSQEVLREEMDRSDWNLPGAQGDLVQAVVAANPRTVLVLVTAGPLAVDWAQSHVPAIVTAFYDGQEQGTAIADVLFGDYDPAGRLTTTWYTGDTVLPPIEDYDVKKGRTYLYYTGTPLYAFGHGLSYTTFSYGNLGIDPSAIDRAGAASVSIDVTNTGLRDGDEVVELYVHDVVASVARPVKELRGFSRIHLVPGQTRSVTFPLAASDLAFWNTASHGFAVEDGSFDVLVGASSSDIRARGTLLVGTADAPGPAPLVLAPPAGDTGSGCSCGTPTGRANRGAAAALLGLLSTALAGRRRRQA